MVIQKLELYNFRNYASLELDFADNLNLIQGNNGQGKTNLAEALYYICNLDSFRTRKVVPLLQEQKEAAVLKAYVLRKNILYFNQVNLSKKGRKVFQNYQPSKKTSEYISSFFAISFTPSDVNLFRSPPGERRRFFDRIISFVYPAYLSDLQEMNQIISQKNALLKRKNSNQLSLWNEMLAKVSLRIIQGRSQFVEAINQHLSEVFKRMTGRRELLKLVYQPSFGKDIITLDYKFLNKFLQNIMSRELIYGHTLVGPHRDDYRLFLDNHGDRDFFSQGEMRITILSLKIAINRLLSNDYSFKPVLIFDDLFSELDRKVSQNITDFFKELENQIFVTSTDIPTALQLHGKNIYIDNGQLVLLK